MLVLLVLACGTPRPSTSDTGEPDDVEDTDVVYDTDGEDTDVVDDTDVEDTGDTDVPALPEFCVDDVFAEEALSDGSVRVRTDHYVLTVDAAADPQDLARLVEAAYLAWTDDFGVSPSDGPLELVLYPTYEAWVDGLADRGIAAPSGAGGYYDPGTRLASLYRQPTAYFTQMLWLHEAFHQFHLESRTASASLPTWYVEGLAEWSSRHDWDGRCVRVGADPRGSWEDYWAQADLGADGADLAAWIDDDAFPGRPEMMSFVHFAEHEQTADWRAFRDGIDFGDPVALDATGLTDAWAAHVRANQEPLVPLWLDWVHRDPQTMRGLSSGALSAIAWKEAPSRLEVEVPVVAGGYAGGLVGLSDDGFDVIFVDATGTVSRWTYTPDRNEWFNVASIPEPVGSVLWEQEGASLWLDGVEIAYEPVLPEAAGHALYDGEADFVTLSAE